MILWSKGLGKLVLKMNLAERSSTSVGDEGLVIDGTMGAPTHWDYAVTLDEDDVLDFVELLKKPAPVRFTVEGKSTGLLVRTALMSGVLFAWNTICCFLGIASPSTPQPAGVTNSGAAPKTSKATDNTTQADRSV